MKEVKDTKGVSIKQMISMTENLREKFKIYSSIDLVVDAYLGTSSNKIHYSLYVENICQDRCKTWQELLYAYHERMGETENE